MTRSPHPRSGFTLLELLIGSSLAAVVLAAVLSSFVFLGRNLTRLANSQVLEAQAREALTYLRRDFALAQSVKTGTSPTATSVTLVLPAGDVTYTYDATAKNLRRQATFGANQDYYLLKNAISSCTSFTFTYYTMTDNPANTTLDPHPASSSASTAGPADIPYSIKQIQAHFVLQGPGAFSPTTLTSYEVVTSRYLLRNKTSPTGT